MTLGKRSTLGVYIKYFTFYLRRQERIFKSTGKRFAICVENSRDQFRVLVGRMIKKKTRHLFSDVWVSLLFNNKAPLLVKLQYVLSVTETSLLIDPFIYLYGHGFAHGFSNNCCLYQLFAWVKFGNKHQAIHELCNSSK